MRHLRYTIIILCTAAIGAIGAYAKKQTVEPSWAWGISQPLGLHYDATIDTLPDGYGQRSIPAETSDAYATTGNLGASGRNMIWTQRPAMSPFFFADGIRTWLPDENSMRFYNTRLPMTLLSYNTAGGRENTQDRLGAIFSGNINSRAQVGALLDYLYSKGCYANQAAKGLTWGASGSYMGDRYEFQGFFNHYNKVIQENGGITDPLYITDPALVQGGVSSVDAKSIPTNLAHAFNRFTGQQLYMNHRYKIGYWHQEMEGDSVVSRTYVPVTSFIYTMNLRTMRHIFTDDNATETAEFFENTYLNPDFTRDKTEYWQMQNTFGVSLLEGFHRYAKFGLGAFATYELIHYGQADESIIAPTTDHNVSIGAQLTKQRGSLLRYDATASIGMSGRVAGEIKADGNVYTNIPLWSDTLSVAANASFHNISAPYYTEHYISNHFRWDNSFGKERTLRFGGSVALPRTGTSVAIEAANVQNHIYFGSDYLPLQHGGSVQLFSASLRQNIALGILHWDNRVTYQTTSDQAIIPMPELAIYSNLYLKFKVATLYVQLGVDCDYYTRYYAPAYQPATATFANQQEVKCGNYPFMNAYANLKLSKTRFYVLYSHFNKGLIGGDNYFSMPLYPVNPSRFQLGLSIDFAN